jgi:hypothetical protein
MVAKRHEVGVDCVIFVFFILASSSVWQFCTFSANANMVFFATCRLGVRAELEQMIFESCSRETF